jgi:SAM-dependent methyltransferase
MPDAAIKEQIRDWWAAAPMTYGERHGSTEFICPDGSVEAVEIGSRRFFELADERFYSWNTALHTQAGTFGAIFPYAAMRGRRVLEVGCGMGCMAMNWAARGAEITAVDLNPTAIAQTRRRFELFDLQGDIRQADAEALPFPDGTFDYAYSWGVLHHTPGTARAVAEIGRVLKPGAQAGVMLYHRRSFLFLMTVGFQEGFVNLERLFLDRLGLASRYGDGAREEGNPHTWPVTPQEVRAELFQSFRDINMRVLGSDIPPILSAWRRNLGERLGKASLAALARRFGWSLWISARK